MGDSHGGHPALDLVNTVSWRGNEAQWRDDLIDAAAVVHWCRQAGVLDADTASRLAGEAAVAGGEATVQAVVDLREAVWQTLLPLLDDPVEPPVLVVPERLRDLLIDALAHSELAGDPLRWRLVPRGLADVPRVLALSAMDLLQSPELRRLSRCANGACGWLFLDRTRNHSRRWCSSGDCGNRDRVRRFYRRRSPLTATRSA
jgi:predicted RNA-binding Zn ribbon-like protein